VSEPSLPILLERDFLVYERHRQDDPEYNALRLSVRRKLATLVEHVKGQAAARGEQLKAQAGLHHPYVFNSYRVREQRAYLCRSDKERKVLGKFFGEALGKDAETHYIQTVLELSLDGELLECALRIHPQAWWDGQNLKKKAATDAGRAELRDLLRGLPWGFDLLLHDWKKEYPCAKVNLDDLERVTTNYTPGNHWLHVRRVLPRYEVLEMGVGVGEWVSESLLSLLGLFRWILWTP
jgi:hypothetical protein